MPRIVPILFMMLLTGCGYHGCISQADVWSDVVRSVIYANPGKPVSGSIHWVKVDFPFSQNSDIELQVQHYGLNFCENEEVKGYKIEISDKAPLNKGETKQFKIRFNKELKKGDKIRFSLDPLREFVVNDEICRNLDEDIVVSDTDECLKNHIGNKHSVYFSSKIGAKSGFINSWYVSNGNGPPFITEAVTPYLISTKYDSNTYTNSGLKSNAQNYSGMTCKCDEGKGAAELCNNASCNTCSNSEILECAEKSDSKQNSADIARKRDEKLVKIREEIRKSREPQKKLFDEYATNVGYKVLCESMNNAQNAGTCKSVHLFTNTKYGKSLPFVKAVGLGKVRDKNVMIPELPGIKEDLSKVPEEFRELVKDAEGEKKKHEASSSSGQEYLLLDVDYVVETEGKEIVLLLSSEIERTAGSYSISVKRDCSDHMKASLVYGFFENDPTDVGNNNAKVEKIDFFKSEKTKINAGNGNLYIGVKDNGDGFDNNTGYFEIQAKTRRTSHRVFGYIAQWTENRVKTGLYGNRDDKTESVVHKLYRHISTSGPFTRMVNALLILYILLSSLYFFLGFSKSSLFQLVCMIAKIVVVIYVLRPDSWTFFNDHLFNFFIDGPKFLIGAMTGGLGSNGDFGFMDEILYRFGVSQTWIQLLALLFSGPVGWISVVLIFWGIIVLVQFLFQAIVIYLISIIAIALLLSIAPYFLICVLFKRTKSIFDMWIKVLLQTAVQPVLIFSCIALLINAINDVIYAMLNFEVCDACVYNIDLKITTLCILSFPLPVGVIPMTAINDTVRELYNTGESVLLGLPGPVFNILIFVALANAARDFVLNSGEMCSIMFGAFTNLSEVGSTAAQSLLSTFGLDKSTGQMLEHHRRQSALFDRGAGAGRDQHSIIGPMVGGGSAPLDGGGSRRRPIIHPHDPPSSF